LKKTVHSARKTPCPTGGWEQKMAFFWDFFVNSAHKSKKSGPKKILGRKNRDFWKKGQKKVV